MSASTPIILQSYLPNSDTTTDCACPIRPVVRPQSTALSPTIKYRLVHDVHVSPLTHDWTMYCNPLAGGSPAVLNRAAEQRLNSFRSERQLTDLTDRQLVEAQLIEPSITQQPQDPMTPSMLTAWIHVTNACNLDCPYCYVRKSSSRMSLATGKKAIDALIATALEEGFTTIKLKYAGGEAPLHYRMVIQLHAYAVQQTGSHGLALEAVVLSNGTSMPLEFADWLVQSNTQLMISVDGIGADHDQQRPLRGGADGAFAALEANLIGRLLPRNLRPMVSITITGRNAASANEVVRWAIGYGLPFSLNFYRENDQSVGFKDLRYEEQQIIVGMLAAYAVVEELLPITPFLNGLLDRVQAEAHDHTCGVGLSYVVITHEGKVAQCQMDLVHAQPFGSTDNLIPLVSGGLIHNTSVTEKQGCRECEWRYRCAGGCPLVTLRATGRTDIKSPNCAIYTALMPAALRLEGLRLLKVNSLG
jgi:uncharacterized protein